MGKGSRNRQLRTRYEGSNPVKLKKKQKKQTPKWLTPLIVWVVVAAILVGVIASTVADIGIVQRNRLIVESTTGKYDITQQVATFIAWQNVYYNSYYYYQYASIGYIDDKNVTKLYSSADSYALAAAQYSIQDTLRNSVEDILESLVDYVAVCDAAYNAGITLTEDEKADISSTVDWLKSMQTSLGFATFNGFLKGAIDTGVRKSDVVAALEIVTLYNKYCTMLEEGYEKAATLADLDVFRKENPQDFYKIDYLGFPTTDKDFADQLKACTTAQEFRELIVKHHFDENYKITFNKNTVTQTATAELSVVKTLTDNNGGTSLSDKLTEIGAGEKTAIVKASTDLPSDVVDWLFKSTRKQYEVANIALADAIYLIAFYSENANAEAVEARIKVYTFEEGESYGDDASFKADMYEQFMGIKQAEMLQEALKKKDAEVETLLSANGATEVEDVTDANEELPKQLVEVVTASGVKAKDVLVTTVFGSYYVIYVRDITDGMVDFAYCVFAKETVYRSDDEKAGDLQNALQEYDFKTQLEQINQLLKDNNAVEKTGVTSSTTSTVVPSVITKAVTAAGVKEGDVLVAGGKYTVFVRSITNKAVALAYVEFKNDVYYDIYDSLVAALNDTYPVEKNGAYKGDAEKDTFEAWLSELSDKENFVSARQEFDTNVFDKKETKDGVETVTYTVYMVVNEPMYLATDVVYNGIYLQFTDSTASDKEQKDPHATQAANALIAVSNKTGYELRDAILAMDSSASSSVSFTESSFSDAKLKEWFLSEDRQNGDVAVITSEDGKSSYLVVFNESMLSWQRTAKTGLVTEKLENQIAEWAKNYSTNEKVLKKLGTLQTSAETTTEETTTAA